MQRDDLGRPAGVDYGLGPAEGLARGTDELMGTAQHVGDVDGRYRRRLRSSLGFLVDQREDAVATLPSGPAQLELAWHVIVMERVVGGRPPPPPGLRARIRDGELPDSRGLQSSDQLGSVGRSALGLFGITGQALLLGLDLLGMLAVFEVVAAVRRHHCDVPATAPVPLDQPTLLKGPSRVRTLGSDGHGTGRCTDLAEHGSLLFSQRVLHELRLHLDELRADHQGRADE